MSGAKESVTTSGPEETIAVATRLLERLPGRRVFALHGELGSGKTCFVAGIARGLGITRQITSPTFTLVNEYNSSPPLYHIDLYRIRSAQEALGIGLEEYIEAEAVIAIEWAERAGRLLPPDAVHIRLEALPSPGRRSITIEFPAA